MDKKKLAINCIIFGSLTLSLELFMLRIMSHLDRLMGIKFFNYDWHSNPLEYIKEPIILYAMAIPVIMVLFGIVNYDTQKNQKA